MFGPTKGDHSQTLALVLTDSIPCQGHGQTPLLKCYRCKFKCIQEYNIRTHILKATFFTKDNHWQTLALVLTDSILSQGHGQNPLFKSFKLPNFGTVKISSFLHSPSFSSVCKLIQGPWKLNRLAKLHGLHSNGFVGTDGRRAPLLMAGLTNWDHRRAAQCAHFYFELNFDNFTNLQNFTSPALATIDGG